MQSDPNTSMISSMRQRRLGLPIEPTGSRRSRPTCRSRCARRHFVAEFELPDEAEPAPVFEA